MMKQIKSCVPNIIMTFALIFLFSCANKKPDFILSLEIRETEMKDAPVLNSFAYALDEGQWLIIGGRTDGLHDHRPDRAYPPDSSNTSVYVIDPLLQEVWSSSLSQLAPDLFEHLQSTNMSFYQDGNNLILIGGYGWSDVQQDYLTFPYLTVVDVKALVEAIKLGQEIDPYFQQIKNQKMAVAGGYLGKIEEEFFLVFGNRFDGPYSTRVNLNHKQEYTNEIRKFRLEKNLDKYFINDYSAIRDTAHFHRRDYNLLAQIFPDRDFGYTAFSGVFQYERNFPWLYPVNIFRDGYEAVEHFEQQFSHYHNGCVSVYRKESNQMDNLFFGGMARFAKDAESGEIVNDPLVPSVNSISQVSRFADGSLREALLDIKMPALLGASANFIPASITPLLKGKIVDFDNLPGGSNLIGYIYGGLQSSQPSTFLQAGGVSVSTNRVFEVYLLKE